METEDKKVQANLPNIAVSDQLFLLSLKKSKSDGRKRL